MKVLEFTVTGTAQPGGSKRAFMMKNKAGGASARVVDANPKAAEWKGIVSAAAAEHMRPSNGNLLRGPLEVHFTFFRPRPAGHTNDAGVLNKKGRESPCPTTRPDVLKLARAAEDAMTGVVWVDDAQIVREVLEKRWGEPARMDVRVFLVGDSHPPLPLP